MAQKQSFRGNLKQMVSYADAAGQATGLDRAKIIPLLYDQTWGQTDLVWDRKENVPVQDPLGLQQYRDRQAVLNLGTGRIAATVSPGYSLLQHQDMVEAVLDGIQRTGFADDAIYRIENDRNIVRLEMLFPEVTLADDVSRDGLSLGFRFVNSVDKSNGFRADVYLWRKVCANGNYLGKAIPGGKINMYHVGNWTERIRTIAHDYVTAVTDNIVGLQEMIDGVMHREVRFEKPADLEATVAAIVGRTTLPDEMPQIPLITTNWEIYQAITHWTTHSSKISNQTRDNANAMAEKALFVAPKLEIVHAKDLALREATEV